MYCTHYSPFYNLLTISSQFDVFDVNANLALAFLKNFFKGNTIWVGSFTTSGSTACKLQHACNAQFATCVIIL